MPFNIRPACFLNPHTRNVLQLGIGFFFIFLAFNSQGFIEESVLDGYTQTGKVDKHAGYTSLSIIYASFTVCNFVAPPIIRLLGTRTSLVTAGFVYVLFLAGFLNVHQWFLYGTSALLGLAAAVLWTAQGKYLTLNSTPQSAGRHSSLFLCCAQACLSCGGLFLLIVFLLSPSDDVNTQMLQQSTNKTINNSFTSENVKLLYSFFTGIALIGVIVLSFLPPTQRNNTQEQQQSSKEENEETFILTEIRSTFIIAKTPKMLALAVVFANTGILLSFWSSIFPTSIINTIIFQSQFSPKILIALNGIVKGAGQPFLSLIFERLQLDKIRKSRIIFVGALIQFFAILLCFINLPNEAPLNQTTNEAIIKPRVWIALICGFLLSFCDACWSTQIFSFLIINYPTQSAQAFALLKFYQSLLTSLLFFFSGYMSLHWHLFILLISGAIGYWAFALAEKMEINEKNRRFASKIEPIELN
uniref:UNC93-like protein MFSD11 n=1 Tax=Meloidogyne hapla TaxID=6305 RepID=A0A1I8BMV6_MELHA